MAADLDARIWAVVGASGTGKGVWTKQQLAKLAPSRLIVWDFKDEYQAAAGARPAASLGAVLQAMRKAGAGPLRLRYVPRGAGQKAMRAEFEALCELVYAFEHTVFVAEELANVTTPSWAPAAWRKMTTSGRHAGVHIIGATQTPALVDKTFLGNCTLVHCCALRNHAHRLAMAQAMDIDPARIAALLKFQYIEKDFDTGELSEGWVEIPGHKAHRAPVGRPSPSPTGGAGACGDVGKANTVAATARKAGVKPKPTRGNK